MPITKEDAGAKVREAGLTEEELEDLLAFINSLPPDGLSTLLPTDPASRVVRTLKKQRGAGSRTTRQAVMSGGLRCIWQLKEHCVYCCAPVPSCIRSVLAVGAAAAADLRRGTHIYICLKPCHEESLLLASQFTGFIEMTDEQSGHTHRTAAVVCSSCHIATYQHGDHQQLKLGDQVQVHLPATHQVIPTQVVLVDSQNLDCIILAVQGKERLPAPELRPGARGEAYALLAQSSRSIQAALVRMGMAT